MRSSLALVILASVVVAAPAQDEDPLPVAPPPRLKTVPTAKKKAEPPVPLVPSKDTVEPKPVVKADPTPEPTPKPTPAPEPAPKTVAKADPEPVAPAPKVEPKAEPKTDAKAEAKADAKAEEKPVPKPAAATPPDPRADPAVMEWTVPLYAVYAFGGLAVLVMIRTFLFKSKA